MPFTSLMNLMSQAPFHSKQSMSQSISTVRFWHQGEIKTISSPSTHETVLEYLRSEAGGSACGTKEGCAEGDCGACTVVIAELRDHLHLEGQPLKASSTPEASKLQYRAVNSCIRFAYQLDGCALWTVEDLASAQSVAGEHPVQQALLAHHGSQCGFCTPGFVMSLFGLYQQTMGSPEAITRDQALESLSGNLCRCTGYRPILDAALAMKTFPLVRQDEARIVEKLQAFAARPSQKTQGTVGTADESIFRPRALDDLLVLRAQYPDAQIIAGATDVGLWVTKQHQRFERVIDVTQVQELRQVRHAESLLIGAAVRLEQAYEAICQARPQVAGFARRFAGRPVRESGTLGGNIANGSPIGDSMPLLISLGTRIRLVSQARGARDIALEDFYLGYRKTQLAKDEILSEVLIPAPRPYEVSRIYKLSKRFEDDISAVCLGIYLELDATGTQIVAARLGVGGVAAVPIRAKKTEESLIGQAFNQTSFAAAKPVLADEFNPISDMRASAEYRKLALSNLLLRFWQEVGTGSASPSQGSTNLTQLDQIALRALAWE